MYFLASNGSIEDVGINALDEWFSYNPNLMVDQANRPQCFIHKECGNLIESLINYGSNGKSDEALKDFFDAIRYLRMHNNGEGPDHIKNASLRSSLRGKGGY